MKTSELHATKNKQHNHHGIWTQAVHISMNLADKIYVNMMKDLRDNTHIWN